MITFAKALLILVLTGYSILIFSTNAIASEKFIAPVYPVRGDEFGQLNESDHYQNFAQLRTYIDNQQLHATWLFRYDALQDNRITTTARLMPSTQELGIFLEITPQLTQKAGVEYADCDAWHEPQCIFLSGYKLADRYKLIDAYMNEFLKVFGKYPLSVGAWHIDASSAHYLSQKYGITSVMICADQYSTDHYQIWGSWWGVPYYPSKSNILTPAHTSDYKLPIVVTQWASRDPVQAYGLDAFSSIYSVQPNDYMNYNLDINYFKHLAQIYLDNPDNPYGFLLFGIENDYPLSQFGDEEQAQIAYVAQRTQVPNTQTVTLSEFSAWYQHTFPDTSPDHTISGREYQGENSAIWNMSTTHREGIYNDSIRDYRPYDQTLPESFLVNKNILSDLHLVIPAFVDTVALTDQSRNTLPIPQYLYTQLDIFVILIWILIILVAAYLLRKQRWAFALILCTSVPMLLTTIKSGRINLSGMSFWGAHGHDAIWHLAIIEHFSRSLNLSNPIFANANLTNYHFLFDILLALINRITFIPNHILYFQIIPPIIALGIGITAWRLTYTLSQSKYAANLSLIFVMLGGSAGWIVNYIRDQSFGGETMFWAQQSISTLINPPYALSLIFLLFGLESTYQYLKQPTKRHLMIATIPLILLAQTKIYASIVILLSLGIVTLIKETNHIIKFPWTKITFIKLLTVLPLTTLTSIAGLGSLLLTIPFVAEASSPFVYDPFWFIDSMLLSADRFHWTKLAQAIQAYQATGNYLKLIPAYGLGILLFIAGNFFTRILGLGYLAYKSTKLKAHPQHTITQIIAILTLISIIIPLLFIQTSTQWNTIQFMYYGLTLSAIYTAIAINQYLIHLRSKKTHQKFTVYSSLFIVGTIVALNLPTTLSTLGQYLPSRAPARIPHEELLALSFLRQQPSGLVLTAPFDKDQFDRYDEPRPLHVYTSTAYVAAFSNHPTVMEDQINLDIIGVDWQPRREEILDFFQTYDVDAMKAFLDKYQVTYIYLRAGDQPWQELGALGFHKIFDNGLVRIYTRS